MRNMDWILENVAVGSWHAVNQSGLKSKRVGAILNVRSDENEVWIKEANEQEEEYCSSHGIGYCHVPLEDFTAATDDEFASGIAFIERNVRLGRKVLVHCGAGKGRSPSFVAVYLLFKRLAPDTATAIALIREKRPECFEGDDKIHISRIREFEKMLPEKLAQIEYMIESFTSNLPAEKHHD